MRPLSQREEQTVVLGGAEKKNNDVINDVIRLAHVLRSSPDAQMTTIANSLSTRQLLRIARRSAKFPGQESSYEAVQKACLTRFLPSLPKDTLTRYDYSLNLSWASMRHILFTFSWSSVKRLHLIYLLVIINLRLGLWRTINSQSPSLGDSDMIDKGL